MFSNLTQEELEMYIYHETHYDEINLGLHYVFYHYDDLMNNTGFIPDAPLQVGLNLTDACNVYCLHCSRPVSATNDAIYMKRWDKIIDDITNCGVVQVFLTGGEPTLHPDIVEIIQYIKEKRLKIVLSTNGLVLENSLVDIITKSFTDSQDYVQFSLDDLYENYEKIRVGSSFEKVKINLVKLIERGINVRVSSVVSEENVNRIFEIYKFCEDNKVSSIRFRPIFLRTRSHFNVPSEEKVIKEFCKIISHKKETNSSINLVSSPNRLIYPFSRWLMNNRQDMKLLFPTGSFVCPATVTSCEISPEGFVYPCSYFDNKNFFAGNVFEEDFSHIWRKGLNWNYIRKKKHISKDCSNCEEFNNCLSGCPAENYFGINHCEVINEFKTS